MSERLDSQLHGFARPVSPRSRAVDLACDYGVLTRVLSQALDLPMKIANKTEQPAHE